MKLNSFYNKIIASIHSGSTRLVIFLLLFVVIIGLVGVFAVRTVSNNFEAELLGEYRQASKARTLDVVRKIENTFNTTYRTLRTISRLPTVKNIKNNEDIINTRDRKIIEDLYVNLLSDVSVSEIYLNLKGFNPKEIDINTNILQEPFMMFDEFIVGRTGDNKLAQYEDGQKIKEIEIYEYRLIKKQLDWFKGYYKDYSGITLPAISGLEVVTCDNSHYSLSDSDDSARSGFVYSVPVYNSDGALNGSVSAIFLGNVLRDLFPNSYYVLQNKFYNISVMPYEADPVIEHEKSWVEEGTKSPNLLYSETMPLSVVDGDSIWQIWVGQPDDLFLNSSSYKFLELYTKIGYSAVLGFVLAIAIIIYLFIRNIVRKKDQSEEKLRQTSTYMELILNSAVEGIYGVDLDENIIFGNPSALEAIGCNKEDNIGDLQHDFIDNSIIGTIEAHRNLADKGNNSANNEVFWYNEGKNFVVEYSSNSILDKNGNIVGAVVVFQDITQRKNEEEENRYNEQKVRAVIDNAVDGIMTIDEKGIIQSFNFSCEKIFGYSADEAIGQSVNTLMPPQEAKDHDGHIMHYKQTGKSTIMGKGRNIEGKRKDGSIFPLFIAVNELVLEDSKLFTGIIRDITKEKAYETELKQHRDNLQEMVNNKTNALEGVKGQDKNVNQLKTDFLSNISQELRIPMHSIISFAELNIATIDDGHNEGQLQNLEIIKDSGERLLAFLNDLLDLVQLESGSFVFDIKEVNIRKIIDESVAHLQALIQEKNMSVEISKSDNLPEIISLDPSKIMQVLTNLLSNAIKASPKDSRLDIAINNATLPVENGKDIIAISVIIKDQGVGIPEDELILVFDKFIHSSKTAAGGGGTGLGLAICKEIIASHNGVIYAKSNDDSGAEFTFTIPISQS